MQGRPSASPEILFKIHIEHRCSSSIFSVLLRLKREVVALLLEMRLEDLVMARSPFVLKEPEKDARDW